MDPAAQPPSFAASLDRLKEQLLQQHDQEVAQLRGECGRLAAEVAHLRAELLGGARAAAGAASPGQGGTSCSAWASEQESRRGTRSAEQCPGDSRQGSTSPTLGPRFAEKCSGDTASTASAPLTDAVRKVLSEDPGRGGAREVLKGVPRRHTTGNLLSELGAPGAKWPSQGRSVERRPSLGRRLSIGTLSIDSLEPHDAGPTRGSSADPAGAGPFCLREVWKGEPPGLRLQASIRSWHHGAALRQAESWPLGMSFLATVSLRTGLLPGEDASLVHPASSARLLWEVLSVVLVLYDLAALPMMSFDWPSEPTADAMDWVSRLFWTADVAASFLTGVYINFELEMRFEKVAKHYARGWLPFDAGIVLSEWVSLAVASSVRGSRAGEAIFGVLRLCRLARIFRLLKLEVLLYNVSSVLNSKAAWRSFGTFRVILYFVVGVHIVACGWSFVGRGGSDGWVVREAADRPDLDLYMLSVHWAVSQLHGSSGVSPGSVGESLYATLALLVGLGSSCFLVSSATAAMLQREQSRYSTTKQHLLMLSYLRKNHISWQLSLAVKKCFDIHMRERRGAEEHKAAEAKELLSFLPVNLQMDMAEEMRRPVLLEHNFLGDINAGNPRILRQICHDCCFEKEVRPAEIVFEAGDACASMYFVTWGDFEYARACHDAGLLPKVVGASPVRRRPDTPFAQVIGRITGGLLDKAADAEPEWKGDGGVQFLDRASWVSEAVLWTKWEHRGELKAAAGGALLQLDYMKFATMLSQHHDGACAYACGYGRKFLERLNKSPESSWSDVLHIRVTKEEVLEDEPDDKPADLTALSDEEVVLPGNWPLKAQRRPSKHRDLNAWGQHYIFVSHHKAGGGTEAALMQEGLERIIESDPDLPGYGMMAPVFLDSEDLGDLSDLKAHVRNAFNLVLLLTEEVLKRPWVLVEIVTAHQSGVNIVPVEIYKRENNSFKYPDDEFYQRLREQTLLSRAENDLILAEGITAEELEKALRHVFKKIAVPFSPHKSSFVREAELTDILRRCTDGPSRPGPGRLRAPGGDFAGIVASAPGPAQDFTNGKVAAQVSSIDCSGAAGNPLFSLTTPHRRSPALPGALLAAGMS